MARQTIGQKAERVLKLLLGLRNANIAGALAAHGFTEKDLREGWLRLADLTRKRLGTRTPVKDPRMIAALDEFENTWFRIAHAALDHRHPEVAQALFLNLSQLTGAEVAVSVATFLERLADMEKGQNGFGEHGPAARQVLVDRGLTADRAKAAQAVVDALGTIDQELAAEPPAMGEQAAEDVLWAWYLEWSGIARVAIRDGRLLRSLGFLQHRRNAPPDNGGGSPTPSPTPPVVTPTPALVDPSVPLLPSGPVQPDQPLAATHA